MAQEYSPNIRVNAIAPGFFITEQNRFLMTDKETGLLSACGQKLMDHTPMGRFGSPEDLKWYSVVADVPSLGFCDRDCCPGGRWFFSVQRRLDPFSFDCEEASR